MGLAIAVALVLAPMLAAERIELALPDGAVKASIEVTRLQRSNEEPNPEGTLLTAMLGDDAMLSLGFEPNFPFLSSAECGKRYAKQPRYSAFEVDGIACCTFEMTVGGVTQTSYHAWPATSDYLFDLHASRMDSAKNKSGAFSRDDFKALVESFRCDGRVDAESLSLPAAVYAFRDEASAHANEQVAWVEAQATARRDEWAVHYYLGALGYEKGDAVRQIAGHERASQLLAGNTARDAKETRALVQSYDGLARGYAAKKRHKDAIAPLTQLIALVPADAPKPLGAYRTVAHYHLAGCQAKSGDAGEALKNLRTAIAAQPELKDAARKDELFDSLRKKPEFKKLVGG